MERLKIKQIKHDGYTLENDIRQEYVIFLNFYDLERPPQIGDYIYLSEKIFYEISKYGGQQRFYFGSLSEMCGRQVTEEEIKKAKTFVDNHGEIHCGTISDEILVIESDSHQIILKRLYG